MKVLMKPVDMIAWFTQDGVPNPIKYRLLSDEKENITIKVGRIIERAEEKLAGNRMIVFKCQSLIDGMEKVYELKYELNSMKWFLFKM